MRSLRRRRALSLAVSVGLMTALVGCGTSGDKSTEDNTTDPVPSEATGEAAAGEGDGGALDYCAAPVENEQITLTVSTPIEGFSPLLLAMESGAFEEAGIDFTLERIPAVDSLAQIAQGRIDGQLTSYSVGNMNAVASGIEMKWVAPFYELPDRSVTEELPGYWGHVDYVGTGDEPDLTGLKGELVASPTAGSGAGGWLLARALEDQGLEFSDVTFTAASGVDSLIALENGAVAAGWLSAPHNQAAHENPDLRLIATYDPGLNGSGIIVGSSLLDRPEVLTKMLQVLAETSAQYLQGDYHQDPEVVEMLSRALDQEPEVIKAGLPLIFDQTLDMTDAVAYVEGLQDFTRANGELDYEENLPATDLIDGSFAEAAAACLK